MQGLARFSLVAVIVLAAVLLGAWAYLTARYGGVEQFLASDDAPRYWRPSPRSEAHDDEPPASDACSLTERVAGEVKRGRIPEDDSRDWKPVEPEPKRGNGTVPSSGAGERPTLEARIDTEFSELAIETDEESITASNTKSSLKPFFARTRPPLESRWEFTTEQLLAAISGKGGSGAEYASALLKADYVIIRGRVVDDQQRNGIENAVIAALRKDGTPTRARAVSNRNGDFVVTLPADEAKQCDVAGRNARLCVIADGLTPAGARKHPMVVDSEADSNGLHQIKLKRSRGLRVRVRVDNREVARQPVRLWCELRDEAGPTFDDNIFMSVVVPARGDVVFRFPSTGTATIRVGASGADCALDAIERDNSDKDVLALRVTLGSARAELCSGLVCGSWNENRTAGDGVRAARVAAAGSTDVTYTDAEGRFEFFARKTGGASRLRVTTVHGFDFSYELRLFNRSDEDVNLTRGVANNDGSYNWRLLAPEQLRLEVELEGDAADSMREPDHLACLPPAISGRPESLLLLQHGAKLQKRFSVATWQPSCYLFSGAPWRSTTFVAQRRSRTTGRWELAGVFTCEPSVWERPDLTVSYDSSGRSVVTLRVTASKR